ncbi:Uncharacterised protein [Kluyvera intermedia]|nr:Uncharacterised protein [Kluyvera intermedia]
MSTLLGLMMITITVISRRGFMFVELIYDKHNVDGLAGT